MAASFSITPYWIIKVTPAATRYFSEGKTIRILGFGKCGERKRFEKIIELVSELKALGRSAEATILCAIDPHDPNSVRCAHSLWQTRAQSGVLDNVVLNFKFLPMKDIEDAMVASHVALFPYSEVSEGASSAVRFAMSCQTLSICSQSKIFSDAAGFIIRNEFDDMPALAREIVELLSEVEAHKSAIRRQNDFLGFSTFERHIVRLQKACARKAENVLAS